MQGAGRNDNLGRLGLRVPMPIFDSPLPSLSSSSAAIGGWGWNGMSPTRPALKKQRSVLSTMYLLGLGSSPMITATRSRDMSTGPQKGDDPAAVVGVESVNEMESKGPIGLVGVGGDEHDTTDTETEDEQDADVE